MGRVWSSKELKRALGANAPDNAICTGVEIDSRRIAPDNLFIALKGENHDGHAFAADAIKHGANLAILSHLPEGFPPAKAIIVQNTNTALTSLGAFARQAFSGYVIGITGSVGKTTVKEMTALALSPFGEVFATRGNFNNHIGLPLCLANMAESTNYAVIEMGMNHKGEIKHLASISRPHIGVITSIAPAHIENFESMDGIADAKAEIYSSPTPGMIAVINGDSPYNDYLIEKARNDGVEQVILYGRSDNANIKLLEFTVSTKPGVSNIKALVGGKLVAFEVHTLRPHQALNFLAAIAVTSSLKLDVEAAIHALATFREPEGRGKEEIITLNSQTITLIDDSYNANPTSTAAALLALQPRTGRKVAVLGDMLELGKDAVKFHVALAEAAQKSGAEIIICCGNLMHHLHDALPHSITRHQVSDYKQAFEVLKNIVRNEDIVLIKGSHGSNMYRLTSLLKQAQAEPKRRSISS